ncbi:outer membrane beta-barrel protein [Marinobacter sp. F4206]|uniref:outer membrane beta-barrel protein n=1 Tax=Marinobacter sp. F4206 TaxID=2861777 RepID=UPI001C5D7547|nr:outer membrane beta-barrel protein [Marinobacter sp. F4206]MBW4936250.1 porin family protein [Marinobacter sp. F4206]
MNKVVRTSLLAILIPATVTLPPPLSAQETPREDLHYVGILGTLFNYRSVTEIVEIDDRRVPTYTHAWGSGTSLVVGGHLTDLFHAEFRAGVGISDAELRSNDASLAIDHFASWYIGMHYPITDYANLYGQFGFSYIKGDADLRTDDAVSDFPELRDEFPESSFGVSWLAGLDFEVVNNTYLVFEGGKLFEDTGTEVNTFQFSGGLRYEF